MTKASIALFAAVSLVACGLTAQAQDQSGQAAQQSSQQQSSQQQQQQQQQQAASAQQGQQSQEQSPHAEDIRRVLARVTEAAVKGNVKQVADNFVTSSQDRFSRRGGDANLTGPDARAASDDNKDANRDDTKAMDDQLKQTADQLAQAWQAKYGHGFSIDRKNEEMVYGGQTFQIMKGDMGHGAAQTAGARVGASGAGLDGSTPSSPATPAATGEQRTGTARIGDTTVSGTVTAPDDDKKDGDRSVLDRLSGTGGRDAAADMSNRMATVVAQQSHGAPTVSVTLVNEGTFGNQWHIQPAAGMDYKTLSQSLNKHLQEVLNMKDQWPQDENEAARAVSHHVLAAIAMPMGGSQRAAGQQQSGDTSAAQPAGFSSDRQQEQQQQQPTPQSSDPSSQQQSQPGQQSQPSAQPGQSE